MSTLICSLIASLLTDNVDPNFKSLFVSGQRTPDTLTPRTTEEMGMIDIVQPAFTSSMPCPGPTALTMVVSVSN